MAARVLMPKGSDTMTEGKVLKWLKGEGDSISNGDALVEIETDKVNMEVEAMAVGVLRKILVQEGAVVPVGESLSVIGKAGEDISALTTSAAAAAKPPAQSDGQKKPPAPAAPAPQAAPTPARPPVTAEGRRPVRFQDSGGVHRSRETGESAATTGASVSAAPPGGAELPSGRIMASPLARRMAKDVGLDISRLEGSGPGGRVVRRDVEGVSTAPPALSRAPSVALPRPLSVTSATASAPLPPLAGPEYRDEPLSMMRKTIAQRLSQSLGPVPHFYLTIEVDMRRAKELRESANLLDPNQKLTYDDIILKAVAAALRKHPEVNASFMGASLRYHNRVHIGIAVAVEGGGLITPVIRDCDRKTLQQISAEAKELAARARVRKLKPEEYVGATFSVSNLGMMGIDEFSAVINPPEGAILAVGAVVEKPVAVDGRI